MTGLCISLACRFSAVLFTGAGASAATLKFYEAAIAAERVSFTGLCLGRHSMISCFMRGRDS